MGVIVPRIRHVVFVIRICYMICATGHENWHFVFVIIIYCIIGETGAKLVVRVSDWNDQGRYQCLIKCPTTGGEIHSKEAYLTVQAEQKDYTGQHMMTFICHFLYHETRKVFFFFFML